MEIDKIAYIEIVDGKILCTKSYGKTKYYIPGGKRDAGETDEETLVREVKEELDVKIDLGTIEFIGIFRAQADGKAAGVEVKMTCYKANYLGTLKASSEIKELRWLTMKDIDLVSVVDVKIFNYLNQIGQLK